MAERKLAWNKPGEGETILRDEPKPDAEPAAEPAQTKRQPRAIHRLTVDIYEDQFKRLSIRKVVDEAGTVTDQIREALDLYLEQTEE